MVIAVVAALLGSFAVAAPAAAATGWDRCPSSSFCIFEHQHGEGKYAYFSLGSQDLTQPIGNFTFNDKVSSAWNRNTYFNFCMYYNINYDSPAVWFEPSGPRTELGAGLNDTASSIRRFTGVWGFTLTCTPSVHVTR
jgi:hypothetical protein